MKDETHQGRTPETRIDDAEVRRLAQRAIGVLTGTAGREFEVGVQHLTLFCDAFIAADAERHHDALTLLRRSGFSGRQIIDHLIPATARLMGERWMVDSISFADVTIGTARLQEAVRSLASCDRSGARAETSTSDRSEILLVLPRGEDHSLGIFVAADQFRRLGYRVEVAVDHHPRQVVTLVRSRPFAMVGITIAGRRTLASTKDLVEKIRTTVTRVTPIVIGGSGLTCGADILSATGADHVAADAQTALRLCGLSAALPEGRQRRGEMPVYDGSVVSALKGVQR